MNTIRFIGKVIKETLKETKRALPTAIVVAIATWLIHGYILVVLNQGFGSSETPLSFLLNMDEAEKNLPLLYVFVGFIFSQILGFFRYGKITSPFTSLAEGVRALLATFKGIKNKGLGSILAPLAMALLLESFMPKGSSVLLGMIITGAVVNFRKKNTSLLFSFLQVFFRDLRKILRQRSEENYKDLETGLMLTSIFLIIFGVLSIKISLSTTTLIVLALVLLVLSFLKNKKSAPTTGMMIIVTLGAATITSLLWTVKVFADDGGYQEAGSNFSQWVRSMGAKEAVMRGNVPAASAFLGSLLGSLANGWNAPLGGVSRSNNDFQIKFDPDYVTKPSASDYDDDEDESEFEADYDNSKELENDRLARELEERQRQELQKKLEELNKLIKEEEEKRKKRLNKIAERLGIARTPSGELRDFSTPRGQAVLRKMLQLQQNEDIGRQEDLLREVKAYEVALGFAEKTKFAADTFNDLIEMYAPPPAQAYNLAYKSITNIIQEVGAGLSARDDYGFGGFISDVSAGLAKTGTDVLVGKALSQYPGVNRHLTGTALGKAFGKKFVTNTAVRTGGDFIKAGVDYLNRGKEFTAEDLAKSVTKNALLSGLDVAAEKIEINIEDRIIEKTKSFETLYDNPDWTVDKNAKMIGMILDQAAPKYKNLALGSKVGEIIINAGEKIINGDFTGEN
ncbi:MAG: hypothetical protein Q4E36_06595 [Bacillota bacterium]|nr:hypothetical protein [Bacillota bacterium]